MNRRFRIENGFTLIELLVAIAIIGIIAAMLFPALGRAKDQAKRTTCLNNLHQIDLGIRMYSDDANDRSPSSAATNHIWAYYKILMQGYVGPGNAPTNENKLFACPADTFYYYFDANDQVQFVGQSQHAWSAANFTSYFFNGANESPHQPRSHPLLGIAGQKLAAIKHPSRTLLVTEWPAIMPYSWHQPKRPVSDVANCPFNDARDMVGFVDGHVDYLKIYHNPPQSLSIQYDPPTGYDYQWSGD